MTYVVNESCIKCKYMDCVEICPVDCFYEGENMLVIHIAAKWPEAAAAAWIGTFHAFGLDIIRRFHDQLVT